MSAAETAWAVKVRKNTRSSLTGWRSLAEDVAEAWELEGFEAKLVLVTRRRKVAVWTSIKPAGSTVTVTLEHHLATVAMARRTALDEARRAVARKVHLFDATRATVIEECLASIDALRGPT